MTRIHGEDTPGREDAVDRAPETDCVWGRVGAAGAVVVPGGRLQAWPLAVGLQPTGGSPAPAAAVPPAAPVAAGLGSHSKGPPPPARSRTPAPRRHPHV